MSSKDNDFKSIIERYISHTDTHENKELEVRFGTRTVNNQKKITKSDYDMVIKNLKAMGFSCENVHGDYMMRIGYNEINKQGKKVRSKIRVELNGHHVIKAYCGKENINSLLEDETLRGYVEFVNKSYMSKVGGVADRIYPYNSDDFGFRVALQSEKKEQLTSPWIRNIIDSWDETEKTFRYIKRFRFKHAEYPISCDMSIVKSSDFNKSHYILEDSKVFKNMETYEIELEVDNDRADKFISIYGDESLYTSIKKSIKIVLQGLQGAKFPVSYSEMRTVLNDYGNMVFSRNNININPQHFIGPSSYTLQTKHVTEKTDSSSIHNIRTDYTVTDKADGERNLCYISTKGKIYLIDSNMRIKFTGSTTTEKRIKNSIIDGELIMYNKEKKQIMLFAAFDVYFVNGRDCRKNPFASTTVGGVGGESGGKKTTYRHTVLRDVISSMKAKCVTPGSLNEMRFDMKLFEVANKNRNIFECCRSVLGRINHESYSYETDGLIFTPATDNLPALNYRHTWDRSFKWKPPEFNTIDFLITFSKEKDDNEIIRTIYQDGVGATKSATKYREIRLLCGFSQGHKDHGYMNPCEMVYKGEVPKRDDLGVGEYQAVEFYPTNPYDPTASFCNIKLKKDSNGIEQMFTTEGDVIENDTIVEFAYDDTREGLWKWIPLRVRHDKTYQFKTGMKNFGNAFHVANSNWQSIHNPITEHMIKTGNGVPEQVVDGDIYYNTTGCRKSNTQPMRDFHNRFVKNLLIKCVTKPGGTLIDFAVGKAGDFPKWITARQSFIYGIDVSRDNIEHKIDGACARYLNNKRDNTNTPDALFVVGDSGKHIKSGDAFETDGTRKVNKAVFGEGPKDKKILGDGVYQQYGVGKDGFDVASCQFALHYFFEDKKTLKTFMRNISECTKVGGYFVGTCYDGETIFKELLDIKEGDGPSVSKNGHKVWEIRKDYPNTTFTNDVNSLGYEISVFQDSINQMNKEYLVNFSYLERIMSNYGFEIVGIDDAKKMGLPSGIGMFKELFNLMRADLSSKKLDRKNIGCSLDMSEGEKGISFLNKYFVFKKVRQVTQEDMHREFGDTDDDQVERKSVKIRKLNKMIKLSQA
jgi:hypothetical protein